MNGDRFAGLLFQAMYATELIPVLPRIIFDSQDGSYARIARVQSLLLLQLDLISVAMHYSVQCGEEVRFTSKEAVNAATSAFPRLQGVFLREPIFEVCQDWDARRARSKENRPVTRDIPTLVLAGEYDPVTPPEWGRLVHRNMVKGAFFEFPGVGHAASFSRKCPRDILLDFLDDPLSSPNGGCIEGMKGPAFLGAARASTGP